MPPSLRKKAKTTTETETTTKRKKKADAKDAPKSGANLSTKAWAMDGPLGKLPLEILHLIMCELVSDGVKGGKALFLFLSANKALYTYSLESDTLFFELYHASHDTNLFCNCPDYLESHPLFSPKLVKKTKDTKPTSFTLRGPLPKSAIFDWRLQFKSMVVFLSGNLCVQCQKSKEQAIIITIHSWSMRFCFHCCAKFMVPKSAVAKFNVTAGDTASLPVHVGKMYVGKNKPRKDMTFYCGFQLLALATQRHGEIKDVRNKSKEKQDSKQERSDMVGAFALLQCGKSSSYSTWIDMAKAAPKDLDPGWFHPEFDRCISRNGYRKNAMKIQARLEGKGTPYPTALRSVEDVISDFGTLVIPQMHRYTKEIAGQSDPVPFFSPAKSPGPVLPSESRVQAYSQLRRELETQKMFIWSSNTDEVVRAMQDYVLQPTQDKLDFVVGIYKAIKLAKEAKSTSGNTIEIVKQDSSNAGESSNEAAKDAPEKKDRKMDQLAMVNQLVKDAAAHEWPAFVPNEKQVAFEKTVVENLAAAGRLDKEEARKARTSRIDAVVRAVSIAKLENASTCYLDLEKLKWSLTYDEPSSPNAPNHAQAVKTERFGAAYVNAMYPHSRQEERKKMLKDVYKNNSNARATIMKAAVHNTSGREDTWWGSSESFFNLSGTYLAYLACPSKILKDRLRFPFDDAFKDVMSVMKDCRTDLVNYTGLEAAHVLTQGGCPYSRKTPFCIHNSQHQCWFSHLQPYGTYHFDESDFNDSEMDSEEILEMMLESGEIPFEM